MANKRRGDDDVPPVEVPATDDGFPVSAAPASEAPAGPEASSGHDDPAGADAGQHDNDGPPLDALEGVEGDATAPLMTLHLNFHREFRKHVHTGTIVAVELVNGVLNGVRECSKPYEQTHGALPVLSLDNVESSVGTWYRAEAINFQTWTPVEPPKVLMDALMKLYEESVEARSHLQAAKDRLKITKSVVEDVDERIFHMLRRIHEVPEDAQIALPLTDPVDEPALPLDEDEDE